jgi:hypothetical protein
MGEPDDPRYRLGVLEGRTAADAVAETLELAVTAYERYWLAEHAEIVQARPHGPRPA